MAAKPKAPAAPKKDKKEKLSIEAEYAARCAAGPAELLRAEGLDGAKLSRYAFDASYQPLGPYIVNDVKALTQLVKDHLAIFQAAATAKPRAFQGADFDAKLVYFAEKVAHGLHSHPGRYVHPDCQSRWVAAPQYTRSAYLTSDSADGARWLSAVMNHFPSGMTPAKLFISQFVFKDAVTTVGELLALNTSMIREAFQAANVGKGALEELVSIFAEVFRNESPVIDGYLPQLLWPVAGGYVALTAMPALAVVNSIAAMRDEVPETSFVRTGTYAIGSGQPQNQSMAAVGTRGNIPLLDCEPPLVFRDANSDLVRQAHASRLLSPVSSKALKAFDKDVSIIPNAKRIVFFKKIAAWHSAEAMSKLVDLRDAVEAGAVTVDKLPQGAGAIGSFVRGEPVTDAVAEELARAVAEAGPTSLFPRHLNSDLVRYSEALAAEIKKMGA